MKLYYAKGACSLSVRIIIHELGLTCDYEAVNLKTKKTATGEDYLKINPKGSVPALLIENHQVLTENVAIQVYLAEKNNGTNLLPNQNDFKRYRILELLSFIGTDLHKSCGLLFMDNLPVELKQTVFIPKVKNILSIFEKSLKNKKYLIDDEFTLPDAYLFVILTWMPHLNVDISEYTELNRYFNEVKKRKSVQQALQEEAQNS